MVERARKTCLCCRQGSLSSPKNPTNLFVGVCQDETDNAEFEDFLQNLINNTRAMWMLKGD